MSDSVDPRGPKATENKTFQHDEIPDLSVDFLRAKRNELGASQGYLGDHDFVREQDFQDQIELLCRIAKDYFEHRFKDNQQWQRAHQLLREGADKGILWKMSLYPSYIIDGGPACTAVQKVRINNETGLLDTGNPNPKQTRPGIMLPTHLVHSLIWEELFAQVHAPLEKPSVLLQPGSGIRAAEYGSALEQAGTFLHETGITGGSAAMAGEKMHPLKPFIDVTLVNSMLQSDALKPEKTKLQLMPNMKAQVRILRILASTVNEAGSAHNKKEVETELQFIESMMLRGNDTPFPSSDRERFMSGMRFMRNTLRAAGMIQ